MKIKILISIILAIAAYFSITELQKKQTRINVENFKKVKVIPHPKADSLPIGIKILLSTYPDNIIGATQNSIIWKDSTEMHFDDSIKNKSFKSLLDSADLEDQVCSMHYPTDSLFTNPEKNSDPGRVRYEPFFLKMYGSSEAEVKSNLVEIVWLPKSLNQKIKVSKINRVDDKLTEISNELDKHPEFVKYLRDPGGTFNWRKIRGTERLSTHSFGITIDINTSFSNYWQWDNKEWKTKGEDIDLKYINKIPLEIAKIFEKHGFIWGGKWYHYDTMHFEYRPELLIVTK